MQKWQEKLLDVWQAYQRYHIKHDDYFNPLERFQKIKWLEFEREIRTGVSRYVFSDFQRQPRITPTPIRADYPTHLTQQEEEDTYWATLYADIKTLKSPFSPQPTLVELLYIANELKKETEQKNRLHTICSILKTSMWRSPLLGTSIGLNRELAHLRVQGSYARLNNLYQKTRS